MLAPTPYLSPDDFKPSHSDVMSNFDHQIDNNVMLTIHEQKLTAGYPAWNFHGTVWYADGTWHCAVRQYNRHVATVTGTLQEIMDECSAMYGQD